MNPKFESAWSRLTGAARKFRHDDDMQVPFGFSTRVVSMAFAQPRRASTLAVFEGLSLRALWVAGIVAVVAIAANYRSFTQLAEQETGSQNGFSANGNGLGLSDPVTEILEATTKA